MLQQWQCPNLSGLTQESLILTFVQYPLWVVGGVVPQSLRADRVQPSCSWQSETYNVLGSHNRDRGSWRISHQQMNIVSWKWYVHTSLDRMFSDPDLLKKKSEKYNLHRCLKAKDIKGIVAASTLAPTTHFRYIASEGTSVRTRPDHCKK